jgi:hypothetical protein
LDGRTHQLSPARTKGDGPGYPHFIGGGTEHRTHRTTKAADVVGRRLAGRDLSGNRGEVIGGKAGGYYLNISFLLP